MTKEEIVRKDSWILAVIRDRCELTQAETDYLNDLIEVLEQEPCEDCISRKAVLDNLSELNAISFYEAQEDSKEAYYEIQQMIKSLQPVAPKPKTMQVDLEGDGYADGELVYDYGKCPKCGWDFEYGDKDWEEPYCCHCGQKLHWFESEEQE